MIVFPNAKINLGLRILGKRSDGYHDIESYMIPVAMADALEIVPSVEGFAFSSSGLSIDGLPGDNLCVRAYELMKKNYNIGDVKIHLHKMIPPGSGLGGGSSDAAFALALMRRIFELKFCNNELEDLAAMLGSDCPFFITNKPQLITGTGRPSHKFIRLQPCHIAIVIPPIRIPTPWAYSVITPSGRSLPDVETTLANKTKWTEMIVNDFEEPVFNHYPQLRTIKQALYDAGAFYASMSGSGSALYGLFDSQPQLNGLFTDCTVWTGFTLQG
ncbi:MAG: 4-(cytidine 5'-diphospho)-2-C-methyl-D-erythritol kinase [Omnitrophica WOR_2 bacterium]